MKKVENLCLTAPHCTDSTPAAQNHLRSLQTTAALQHHTALTPRLQHRITSHFKQLRPYSTPLHRLHACSTESPPLTTNNDGLTAPHCTDSTPTAQNHLSLQTTTALQHPTAPTPRLQHRITSTTNKLPMCRRFSAGCEQIHVRNVHHCLEILTEAFGRDSQWKYLEDVRGLNWYHRVAVEQRPICFFRQFFR